jgi:hypothetical protein
MESGPAAIDSQESFERRLREAREKTGKVLLDDDNLFVLTCEKLLHTYTFEERGYA